MTAVYKLDDHSPVLPKPGGYWIAPSASVASRVRIGRNVGIWFGATCAATTRRSRSASGPTSTTTPSSR